MDCPLPTLAEINVHDSLDERRAAKHFFGKDLKHAEDLFREKFLYYQEDLMWMGPKAFCYYMRAAIAYALSSEADGDSDVPGCFCMDLEFQLEYNSEIIRPIYPLLRDAIEKMLANFSRFDCDPEIFGDLPARCSELLKRLSV